MQSLHERRRDHAYDPSCFGCRASTVRIGLSEVVRDIDQRERTLTADRAAYKAFRKSGLQPQHLAGSAELERTARSPLEVENPRLMSLPDEARQFAGEAAQLATEIPQAISKFKETG